MDREREYNQDSRMPMELERFASKRGGHKERTSLPARNNNYNGMAEVDRRHYELFNHDLNERSKRIRRGHKERTSTRLGQDPRTCGPFRNHPVNDDYNRVEDGGRHIEFSDQLYNKLFNKRSERNRHGVKRSITFDKEDSRIPEFPNSEFESRGYDPSESLSRCRADRC